MQGPFRNETSSNRSATREHPPVIHSDSIHFSSPSSNRLHHRQQTTTHNTQHTSHIRQQTTNNKTTDSKQQTLSHNLQSPISIIASSRTPVESSSSCFRYGRDACATRPVSSRDCRHSPVTADRYLDSRHCTTQPPVVRPAA